MIETPCKTICILDPHSGLCRGCGRDLAEIERWTAMTDRERRLIMDDLPRRLAAMPAGDAARP
jgi:predicted Fe-S protein YdhL (DUF1289 family)